MSITAVLTIFPTALKVEDVLKARARAGDVSLGHRLTTFPELLDAIDREIADAPAVVSEAIAVVLVQEAIAESLRDETLDARPGLARAVRRTLGELAAACLGPDELRSLAAAAEGDETRRRLGWLARVAEGYARRVARLERVDRHARDRRVLELLHRHEDAGTRPRVLAGVERLVIAEIYDYSPLQSLIARALIRIVGDAELVTLAHGENVDATRFVERTWNRFVEDPGIADKVLPDFVVRGGRVGTLSRVLSALFVEPKPPRTGEPADESVAVVGAGDRAAEVAEVGRRIHEALAAGVPAERIAVLARDLRPYRALLEDVARRDGFPLALGAPRRLASHASVQTVLALIRTVVDGVPREAFACVMESPYLRATPRRGRRLLATIGYVDAATLPVERCLAHADARFETLANDDGAPGRDKAARDLRRVRRDGPEVAALARRLATLDGARSVAGHAAALLALVGELGLVLPDIDAVPGEAATEGPALGALQALLAELAALDTTLGARRAPLTSFLGRLVEAIETVEVETPGPAAAGVRVLAIADARGLDFDHVFVIGLDDGSFPAPLSEDALLGDAARREINRHAPALIRAALGPAVQGAPLGRLLRASADRAAEDPFLFYLALSTAERRVVVTYPSRDERGDALVRSPFVDEVTAIAGDEVRTVASDGAPVVASAAGIGELLGAAVVAAVAGRPGALAAVGACLPRATLADVVGRILAARRRERYFLSDRERDAAAKDALADAFVGRLPADSARRERLQAMVWSASRLEELAACGFKFFAHRVLRLDVEPAGTESLDGREEGTLVHRLLEAVIRRCDPLPSEPDAAEAAARAVAAECHAVLAAETRAADPRLFELAWTRALEAVIELVRAECTVRSPRTRRLLEWPFRTSVRDPRPSAGAAPLALTLHGVLDRADLTLDADGRVVAASVLDYKNAKRGSEFTARLDPAGALGTTSFQIPIYALALATAPDLRWADDAEIRGGYVLMRSERKLVVRQLPPHLVGRGADGPGEPPSLARRIIALVDAAAAGRFDVEPRECSRFCDYRHICRYEPPPEEGE